MRYLTVYQRALKPLVAFLASSVFLMPLANAGFAVAGTQSANVVYSGNEMTPMPKFLNKAQAVQLEQKTGDKVRVAYNIDDGKDKALGDVPDTYYFYYNPYSQIISAAVTSQDAIDLAQVIPQVFFVVKGDTLSSSMQRWAAEAGYQLQWDSDYDYHIQYSYSFHGDLTSQKGPLNELLQSFSNNSESLKASVMGNKVIVIKDNSYTPNAVVGY